MEKRPKILNQPLNGEFIYLDKEVNPTMDIRLWFVIQQIMAWIHISTPDEKRLIKNNLLYLIKTIDQSEGN